MIFNKHLHSSIKNKFGVTALDIIPSGDDELRSLVRKYQAQASVSADDVASGKILSTSLNNILSSMCVDDDDDDDGSGSGSGSEE
jgi:hypothetical protein